MVPYGREKLGCAYEAVELAKQLIPQADREYVIVCCVDSAINLRLLRLQEQEV